MCPHQAGYPQDGPGVTFTTQCPPGPLGAFRAVAAEEDHGLVLLLLLRLAGTDPQRNSEDCFLHNFTQWTWLLPHFCKLFTCLLLLSVCLYRGSFLKEGKKHPTPITLS